jgi:hypothetical protein
MPFDPKLLHPEEPSLAANGELDLDPALASLAEQLTDDAAHLAASYPPTSLTRAPSAREETGRRRAPSHHYTAALIACALAACLVSFVLVWQGPTSKLLDRSSPPSETSHAIATQVSADTTISLTDLSTPEIEALLDLTDRSPHNAIRVSF